MTTHRIDRPTSSNGLVVGALLAINLWQFLIVPLLPPVWAWTLLPLALSSNTLWAAIHEAIHMNLFRHPRANRWGGRALSCVFGSSFFFLCAGHLTHHALNRVDEQLEVLKPGENIWVARARYYFFLCGGLYLAEMLVPLVFIAPTITMWRMACRSKDAFLRTMIFRALMNRRTVVFESLATISFLGLSALLYGPRWPIFAGILAARAFFISALDYIYHYGVPVDDVRAASNLYLPPALSRLLLNFNLHYIHHASPMTPWRSLPESNARRIWYSRSFFSAAIQVWKGPRK